MNRPVPRALRIAARNEQPHDAVEPDQAPTEACRDQACRDRARR